MTATKTTTVAPRARQPVRHDDDSDWAHGPVAGAINASLVTILIAVAIRVFHLPPGLGLLVGTVMAAALVAAGQMRKPRRLALRSQVYRGAAMLTAGGWLWIETADFTHLGAGVKTGLTMFGLAGAGALVMVVLLRKGRGLLALVATGFTFLCGGTGGVLLLNSGVGRVFTVTVPLTRANFGGFIGHAILSVAIFAAVFAVLGRACANHEQDLDDVLERALLMRSHGREMMVMQALLRGAVRAPNLRVTKFEKWDNAAGENYIIDGTEDGTTPSDITAQKDTLASKLDLPTGCGVEAVQGVSRGRIVVAVSRVNKIKDDHVYPDTYKQRSIYNRLPIGVLRDGTEVGIALRESSAFVFGQKRSGKTTTLYDIAAGICQCTDAMIWVIDLGGGGVALPFLYPYAQGRVRTPAVDWVATTVDEAKKMADLALAIATDRKATQGHRKLAANTNLLPLGPDLPEIIIMIDEGRQIMGESTTMTWEAKQVRGILEDIVAVGGDSGVNVVFSGLNATQGVIDREILSHLAIRVGMRVTEGRELAYGFDADYTLNPADIPYQGAGFVKASHEEGTRVFKAYLLEPRQMGEIAVAAADWRPELDDRAKAMGGGIYADRWSRTKHLLRDEAGNMLIDVANPGVRVSTAVATLPAQPATDGGGEDAQPPAGGQQPGSDGRVAYRPGDHDGIDMNNAAKPFHVPGSPDDVIARADRSNERLHDAASAADDDQDDEDRRDLDDHEVRRRFESMMKDGFDWSDPAAWPEPPAPPGIETDRNPHGPAVLEKLVRHAGEDGIAAKDIKEKLKLGGPWGPPILVSDQTIHEWLAPGRRPAPWLAKRRARAPYVHRQFARPDYGSSP